MAPQQVTALIAAAGSGERLGAGGPKALVEVAGRPLLAWCLDAFAASASVDAAVIAAPPGHEDEVSRAAGAAVGIEQVRSLRLSVVSGGATRTESVGLALAEAGSPELVAVHDAARPLLRAELVEALVARLSANPGAAGTVAATPIADTVKRAAADGTILATESREGLWAAQTPQAFRTEALRAAHAGEPARLAAATDDAMLVEQAGGTVLIEPAPATNLKVTTREDLALARLLLGERDRGS